MKKSKKSKSKIKTKAKINLWWIGLGILICLGAGFLGSSATMSNIPTWYVHLKKPMLTPPSWIFAPVWTLLYIMMGTAAGIVASQKTETKKNALVAFAAQLTLNVLWSFVFFGKHDLLGGLIIILAMWLLIVCTIRLFKVENKLAAILLWPYLAWVTFATYLTAGVLYLNK